MGMFWLNFLLGLFLSGLRVRSSLAFPPTQYTQHALFQGPQPPQSQSSTHTVLEQQKEGEQVNTLSVSCHPDSLEIVIKADMFAVGAPVNRDDLRLGVEHKDYCRAAASSGDEYRITVGLADCGTKHWMTEDSLVYTNLLIYSPVASLNGVIRMAEAVIPIECHYERKYSLSSSSLRPTWIPFMSTQAAVETLQFDLKLMTNDWRYKKSANVFHLGEPISIEASVRVGHHMGLRLFLNSCVATLYPDMYSDPKYTFVENGCLVDSQLPGSNAHFLPRTQDDKLQLVIDAFKFHNDDRGELYITCHLNAVPVNDAEVPNKACTFMNGRWRSADGNDYLCGYCQSQNEVGQTHNKPSNPGKFGPRGFGKPAESEPLWRSGMNTNRVWKPEARVGPVMVLPSHKSGPSPNVSWMDKSGPLPLAELPPVLHQISRTSLYGSQWRSGINGLDLKTGLLPGTPATPDLDEEIKDGKSVTAGNAEDKDAAPLEKSGLGFKVKSLQAALNNNATAAPSEFGPPSQFKMEITLSNATATHSDPKK